MSVPGFKIDCYKPTDKLIHFSKLRDFVVTVLLTLV